MALDPSLQETLFKKSVRKYFVDVLETLYGRKVYFDRQYSIPKDGSGNDLLNWVVVFFNGIKIDTMSTGMLEVYCYSRKDEGDINLSFIRDQVVGMFVDDDMPDAHTRVNYYNDSWQVVGKMIAFVDTAQGKIIRGADGTNAQMINVNLRWGTK